MKAVLGRTYRAHPELIAPIKATTVLTFWGNVVFFGSVDQAIEFQAKLPYYQQEDSMISPVQWTKRKKK